MSNVDFFNKQSSFPGGLKSSKKLCLKIVIAPKKLSSIIDICQKPAIKINLDTLTQLKNFFDFSIVIFEAFLIHFFAQL